MTRGDLIEAMARAAYDAEWGHGCYDADRTSPFERETMTIQMTAALSAIEALGLVVVPREATEKMFRSGNAADFDGKEASAIYDAMIAANPLAQNPEQG